MTSTVELARRISNLERAVASGRVGQLGHSSFEGGGITHYSSSGEQVISRYGDQFDGTGGVALLAGPVPPQPTDPTVEALPSAIKVTWDGHFAGGQFVVAPLDFNRVEIHVSLNGTPEGFDGLMIGTLKGAFESARGGEYIVQALAPDVPVYVRLTTRSVPGKASTPSGIVGPITPSRLPTSAMDIDPSVFSGNTVYYGAADPSATLTPRTGDLWLAETDAGPPPVYEVRRWSFDYWEALQDQGIVDSLAAALAAQQAADSKAKVFTQDAEPVYTGAAGTAVWFDSNDGNRPYRWDGAAFVSMRLGNGAIEPQSLIAEDVIATGTITAALFEAILILATEIVAGDPNGTHVRMTPTGFRVYRLDPVDGIPDEVARMGTDTDDYFGIIDAAGALIASIDATGALSARTANIREDIILAGVSLLERINELGGRHVGRWGGVLAATSPIRSEYGLCGFSFWVEAGRTYLIALDGPTWACNGDGEAVIRARVQLDGPVTITSTLLRTWYYSGMLPLLYQSVPRTFIYNATATGMAQIGLSLEFKALPGQTLADDVYAYVPGSAPETFLNAFDMGPSSLGTAGQQTSMGGQLFGGPPPSTPPAVVSQRRADLAPAAWFTYKGDGTQRSDVPGPVQGWDPSGQNGDGGGFWTFNLPSITGTVDRVDFYSYTNHWYYNSGGYAIFNMVPSTANSGFESQKLSGENYVVGGFQKPGGKQVTLPTSWYSRFRNDGGGGTRASGISVGRSGGTNLNYYGRWDGASARLYIWYTQ